MGVITSYFTDSQIDTSSVSVQEVVQEEEEEFGKEDENDLTYVYDFEDVETDKESDLCCVHTLEGHESYVRSICMLPGEVLMATGDSDGVIIIWDTTDGTQKKKLLYHENDSWVYSLVVFQENILLSSSREGKIIMTDIRNFKKIGQLQPPKEDWIISLCVLDHNRFLYGDAFGRIGLYECQDKEDDENDDENDENPIITEQILNFTHYEFPQSHKEFVECMIKLKSRKFMNHFASSGGTYMDQDCNRDYRIRVYNYEQKKLSFILPEFHRNEVRSIVSVIADDEREYLISGSLDRTVCLFDLSARKVVTSIDCEERITTMINFSINYVIFGTARGTIFLKNWKNQTLQKKVEHISDWWISHMIILPKSDSEKPDERYLVTASNDNSLKIWSVRVEGVEFKSRKEIYSMKDLHERTSMLFHPEELDDEEEELTETDDEEEKEEEDQENNETNNILDEGKIFLRLNDRTIFVYECFFF